jgi:hypothetical protein
VDLLNALTRLDQRVVPRLARGLYLFARTAGQWRVRPLTVVASVLVIAVAGTAVWRLVRTEPGASDGKSTLWVGVHDGDSVPGYVEAGRAELAALTAQAPLEPVFALVSFIRYLTPDQVRAVAATTTGLTTVRGYARVPLPQRQTERVELAAGRLPDDLLADMAIVATRKETETANYDRLADNEPAEHLRGIYRSNADVTEAEALAYRGGCACVFALLVRATPTALTALAGHGDVRVVDSAPDVGDVDEAVFVAPLPEQVDRIEPPPDEFPMPPSPVPTG